ncbi:hypothetical protein V865_008043 [Kwoniella europaea PYCC6329]|uniref:Uncharacterized protein n=1 Tax=Kwoniella europaea PYCC6329 TaxID=1423913 RepID=A0AAX4KU76_9TREE
MGNWDGDDHDGDPLVDEYSNSTFHASSTSGDSMEFDFVGNGIWLFGASRPNHGFYSVQIDRSRYEGSDTRDGYGWLDLDFIVYQTYISTDGPDLMITTGTPRVQLHL